MQILINALEELYIDKFLYIFILRRILRVHTTRDQFQLAIVHINIHIIYRYACYRTVRLL